MPTPATTYEELKETIAAAYPRLSPQLQRLSRFALEKPHDLAAQHMERHVVHYSARLVALLELRDGEPACRHRGVRDGRVVRLTSSAP